MRIRSRLVYVSIALAILAVIGALGIWLVNNPNPSNVHISCNSSPIYADQLIKVDADCVDYGTVERIQQAVAAAHKWDNKFHCKYTPFELQPMGLKRTAQGLSVENSMPGLMHIINYPYESITTEEFVAHGMAHVCQQADYKPITPFVVDQHRIIGVRGLKFVSDQTDNEGNTLNISDYEEGVAEFLSFDLLGKRGETTQDYNNMFELTKLIWEARDKERYPTSQSLYDMIADSNPFAYEQMALGITRQPTEEDTIGMIFMYADVKAGGTTPQAALAKLLQYRQTLQNH